MWKLLIDPTGAVYGGAVVFIVQVTPDERVEAIVAISVTAF